MFNSAIEACQARYAPGLNDISYEISRKFSEETCSFVLSLFNYMLRASSFPSSRRNTYVIFILKPGGKGHRPISLTSSMSKLFERMVYRRLEHQAEHGNWVPHFHFGFRRGRSALDAVAMVSTDVIQTPQRELRFSADGSRAKTCGVGVPQDGVLSPILFNIYTSRLMEVLPLGVRLRHVP